MHCESPPQRVTGLHSLPPELIASIVHQFGIDPPTIVRFAMTHSSFTELSLFYLYRHLILRKDSTIEAVARSAAVSRFKTVSLTIDFQEDGPVEDGTEVLRKSADWLSSLLDKCSGLSELELLLDRVAFPASLLHHPALDDLRSLNVSALLWRASPNNTRPIQFRLKTLTTPLLSFHSQMLTDIAAASLHTGTPSLTKLTILNSTQRGPYSDLEQLAPHLKFLRLPIVHQCHDIFQYHSESNRENLSRFLSLTSSLVHLEIQSQRCVETPSFIAHYLEVILSSLVCPALAEIKFCIPLILLTSETLNVISRAITPSCTFPKLACIAFPYFTLSAVDKVQGWRTPEAVERVDSWKSFLTSIMKRGTAVGFKK